MSEDLPEAPITDDGDEHASLTESEGDAGKDDAEDEDEDGS